MRARRRSVLVGLLGVVLLTAGCAPAPAAPPAPPSPFPPRPTSLVLPTTNLCAALTPEQKQERGVDMEDERVADLEGGPAPTCNWSNESTVTDYTFQVVSAPAAIAVGPGTRIVTISGFGAVREPLRTSRIPGSSPFCQIPIDANDRQAIRVQYASGAAEDAGDAGNPADLERACGVATRLAEDILANLQLLPDG